MTNFKPIVNMLQHAGEKLKYPKVRLQLEDGTPLHLQLAGSQSSRPGTVNITDGGSFGNNKWFGRIDQYGFYQKSSSVGEKDYRMICKLLFEFQQNPAETARVYGKLTSNCCFCGLGLTDDRSVTAGYGPVCAENYGLPWGEIVPEICNVVEEFTLEDAEPELTKEEQAYIEAKLRAPKTIEQQLADIEMRLRALEAFVANQIQRNK